MLEKVDDVKFAPTGLFYSTWARTRGKTQKKGSFERAHPPGVYDRSLVGDGSLKPTLHLF